MPPLEYDLVRAMKAKFPSLTLVLNGGLETIEHAKIEMEDLNGVMLGRAAYHNPWILSGVDQAFFGKSTNITTREDVVQKLIAYAQCTEDTDPSVKALLRHIMGLFHGEKGARLWRRSLSEADRSLYPSRRIQLAYNTMCAAREAVA